MLSKIELLFSFLLCFTLMACAPVTPHPHPHILVDRDGYPLRDDGGRMSEPEFEKRINEIRTKVAEYIESSGQQGKKARLLVMIHGGMTGRRDGLNQMDQLLDDELLAKVGGLDSDVFPVFVNWDSSLRSSLTDDLFLVRRGRRDPVAGVLTSPIILFARLVEGVVYFPVTLVHHLDTWKMQFEKWKKEDSSPGATVAEGALNIITLPPALVTLPFLSAYGEGAWNMMQRRIDQMFAHQIAPLPPFYTEKVTRPGALREFFEIIESNYGESARSSAGGSRVEVILAGHSMGAIVGNRILRDFPALKFSRIVYLGAAASIEDFITTVPPYLSRYRDTEFYSFSLSVRDEGGEFNYFAPRGSLLVWIDSLFDPGLSATGNRVGSFVNRNAIGIRNPSDEVCKRIHFLKFTGQEGDPRKHGQFNDPGIFQNMLAIALDKFDSGRDHLEKRFEIHENICLKPTGFSAGR